MGLERYLEAQANPRSGYATAVAELRAGAKRGHWIWWVFPQIAGLGGSNVSTRYALEDTDEAREYLLDPVLGLRLAEAVGIVRGQCACIPLPTLMGSHIDCLKLVSCLTLFARIGRDVAETGSFVEDAEAILLVAAKEGFPRCQLSARA